MKTRKSNSHRRGVSSNRSAAYQRLRNSYAAEIDLVCATEIAKRLNRAHRTIVHTWMSRHEDFPRPIPCTVAMLVWDWKEVEAWAIKTNRLASTVTIDNKCEVDPDGVKNYMLEAIKTIRKVAVSLLSLVPEHMRDKQTVRRAFDTARSAVLQISGDSVPDEQYEKAFSKFCIPK